ncbi:MAG: glycerophosphodiester phosphodiesterase [Oceanospirillaceae bacterium]|nr:glycerophosphodiester phosphodiesterase [Oceanospirillaceae bacterium]MBT11141.1 glycerophosphodiester phosphodiesterase [Oceanospirillaceae bacterium]|tara:strand:+ start:20732 stop:21520 length:789 start_codon:yes stop_codon:yes gene_type:complete
MPTAIPLQPVSAYEFITPVVAHRGASGQAPENTAAAIRLAAAQGAHWVEVDVTISADGFAVIHHDHDLKRCSDGSGLVIQQPLAQLRNLDCGSWFDAQFSGEPLLALSDLVSLANELEIGLNLEIKPTPGREDETVWAIADTLKTVHNDQAILLSSFSVYALRAARDYLPHLTRALNVEAIPKDWQNRLEELDCQGLHFAREFAQRGLIQEISQAGYHTLVFTVNDGAEAQRLLDMGVSAVFTDYPAQMIRSLSVAGQSIAH